MATHHVVDCATGIATYHESTPEQLAELEARAAEHAARLQAQQTAAEARTADLATLQQRAATDPDFAALVRLLGFAPADAPEGTAP